MLLGMIMIISAALSGLLCWGTGGFEDLTWLWLLPVGFAGIFLVALLLLFGFLLAVILPLDPETQRENESKFYRRLTNFYIKLIVQILGVKFEVQGMEKRPKQGRFLLVSNHLHEIDPAILMRFLPKSQMAFVAKREVKGMFLVGKILPQLLSPFINRENDREALKTILRCIQLLKEDKASVGIFPEGYINDQRKLKRFRPGVFKIAQKAKVPIVVCTLLGTDKALKDVMKLKRPTVRVHLLEVIQPEDFADKNTTDIAEYVYGLMAADLGPENCYQEEST